jgi:hypothetical protein
VSGEEVTSQFQQAIEAIRYCADHYKIPFDIRIGNRSEGGRYKVGGKSFWRIVVMDKKFVDDDFVECARQAVKFVYEAHEKKEP